MENQLQQLKSMTTVVADTGDIEAIGQFTPVDATTNPSLLLKAAGLPIYAPLLNQAKSWASAQSQDPQTQLSLMTQKLSVLIGLEILKVIPGRISTEVDARLSFNTEATVEQAYQLIRLYNDAGISNDRILIKIASTWEGIQAARILEKEGINCNLTLLFSFAQAAACADAGAYLISPFVGRILDWYKANQPEQDYSAELDPGVISVSSIYNFYKANGYKTIVMGASFRNITEIQCLSGCDRLTISPQLMSELEKTNAPLIQQLSESTATSDIAIPDSDEMTFRWLMNEDAMATEKLAEGIRNFAADQVKLEKVLSDL
ncbi:transaldolase [Neptunomonas qingdaonensis]|uniref:Transaldolase n=1 Tax=Neptunomonas qingdaonensis TaxID=1045558 RepID=A0A1I2SXK5_9GAMM|nr:transaldolase [Neptunomonas qingdaonensis]SFG54906.1 transaldolase [Neptunomonas qingdaonensis]